MKGDTVCIHNKAIIPQVEQWFTVLLWILSLGVTLRGSKIEFALIPHMPPTAFTQSVRRDFKLFTEVSCFLALSWGFEHFQALWLLNQAEVL